MTKNKPISGLCSTFFYFNVSNSRINLALPADQVVIAMGYRPVNNLCSEIKDICKEVYTIGGAVKTSNALDAIHDGFDVGMKI